MCDFLVENDFDSVNISIDATTPETLKLARGITALDKLQRNVKRLLDARTSKRLPRVGVTFVAMPYNKHEINTFISYWKEFADFRFTGYSQINLQIFQSYQVLRLKNTSRIPCKQIYRDIVIRANGDVTPCVITSESHNILQWETFSKTEV